MSELSHDRRFGAESKMLGVLVGADAHGERVILRSFSGTLDGQPWIHGFVGPTRASHLTASFERDTLAALSALSARIAELDASAAAARARSKAARAPFDDRIRALETARCLAKAARRGQRDALARRASRPAVRTRLAELAATSQSERRRIRDLRRKRAALALPLEQLRDDLLAQRRALRQERRRRSQELQALMHRSHGLINFAGTYASLGELFTGTGIPSGAAECCAPKLLQEAALRCIRPLGIAEFWWGPAAPDGSRCQGSFYPACEEKCAPILGHQLCGAASPRPCLPILFEDRDIIAVDKPAGLLSVPGRTTAAQDCVESRLKLLRPHAQYLRAVHRLDQASSGILVIARSAAAHRTLSMAFADGSVSKTYEAIVRGQPNRHSGVVELPLRADLSHRPRQVVDSDDGKPAVTEYEVIERSGRQAYLRLRPITGRTHQLRVHCAAPEGLDAPIVGDALYGRGSTRSRLLLHARRLELDHPTSRDRVVFESPADLREQWKP